MRFQSKRRRNIMDPHKFAVEADRISRFQILSGIFLNEYRSRHRFAAMLNDYDLVAHDRRMPLAQGVLDDLSYFERNRDRKFRLRQPFQLEFPLWGNRSLSVAVAVCFERTEGVLSRAIGPWLAQENIEISGATDWASATVYQGMIIDDDEGCLYATHTAHFGNSWHSLLRGTE